MEPKPGDAISSSPGWEEACWLYSTKKSKTVPLPSTPNQPTAAREVGLISYRSREASSIPNYKPCSLDLMARYQLDGDGSPTTTDSVFINKNTSREPQTSRIQRRRTPQITGHNY